MMQDSYNDWTSLLLWIYYDMTTELLRAYIAKILQNLLWVKPLAKDFYFLHSPFLASIIELSII